MGRSPAEELIGSVREGLSGASSKAQDAAEAVARRVEDVLDDAGATGKRIRKELARRWKTVDRVGRDNAFFMAMGALGIGILVGYLLGRED